MNRDGHRTALPGGTVTFLFTDIEGSTRLVERLSERYATVLDDHQRLLREAFAESAGREIDTQGDAFFVVFPRAKDAIAAALAAQRALARHRWPHGVTVRVRMGLHTGEPATAQDRYIGLGVHRAARLCRRSRSRQTRPSAHDAWIGGLNRLTLPLARSGGFESSSPTTPYSSGTGLRFCLQRPVSR